MRSTFVRPQGVLILITLFWGSTFVVTKDVLDTEHMPTILYVSTRYIWGALCMVLGYSFFEKRTNHPVSLYHGIFKQSLILGFLQALGIIFQVFGQHYTVPIKSAFLTSFCTPLTPLLAWVFYKARIRKTHILAILIGVFGLFFLTYPAQGFTFNPGDFLTLGCAVIYAFVTIQTTRLARPEFAVRLAAGQTLIAACFLGVVFTLVYVLPENVSWLIQQEKQDLILWKPTFSLVLEWVYMVLVCTVLTFFLQNWSMSRMSSTQAAVILALEPVFTMTLDFLWFKNWPQMRVLFGAGLILLALFISEIPSTSFGKKREKRKEE